MNKEDGPSVGPWLLGLFIFVVCGSGRKAVIILVIVMITVKIIDRG